ncbi:MAG TPA: hypothetical protein VIW22_01795 [Nitrososphaerales archaeon]
MASDAETDPEDGLKGALNERLEESKEKSWLRMKVAVIDVGFNSLKMVKYKVEPDGSAKSYGQLGVMAKLGEGLERTGYLGNEPISRTIDALRLCRETASLESIDHVLSIGTSPVREAANREEFLKRVQEVTGLKLRVLSGNEEALYALGRPRGERNRRLPAAGRGDQAAARGDQLSVRVFARSSIRLPVRAGG